MYRDIPSANPALEFERNRAISSAVLNMMAKLVGLKKKIPPLQAGLS